MMTNIAKLRHPDFIIVGAMKCMTSTLHEQLAAQDGIFMTDPKEPCYFSDDEVYRKGPDWYASLFAAAEPTDVCGESSTHYTKLPTYPHTVSRMHAAIPNAKLIYVMRHPIDRLVSQYIHDWTERLVNCPIDAAIDRRPEFIDYGRYDYQLAPFLAAFGPDKILPIFFERLSSHPQHEMNRIAKFLGITTRLVWDDTNSEHNASAKRLRRNRLRDAFMHAPGLTWFRRSCVPRPVRESIKAYWQMRERPRLSAQAVARLTKTFDADLARLGARWGVPLSCDTWRDVCQNLSEVGWAEADYEVDAAGTST